MLTRTFIPRSSEANGARHIRHDVIVVYLAEGAIEVFKMFTPDLQSEPRLITANINVDYIKEISLGKDVAVTTMVKKIGNSSFTLHHEVYQDKQLCAKGLVTLINFNYTEHKPETIPQDIRQKLEEHMIM